MQKKYVICALCSNMQKMRQHVKYVAVAYSCKTDMPDIFNELIPSKFY